jgi:hypothetical protein
MTTVARHRISVRFPRILAWWAGIALPAGLALLCAGQPRWVWMWTFAFGIYAGLKWLSFIANAELGRADRWRSVAYLLLWPGMDAAAFLDPRRRVRAPGSREWISAAVNMACGLGVLIGSVPPVARYSPLAAGWVGLTAICLVLHFGLFKLLSLIWRKMGVEAVAIMHAPFRSASLSEFWGRRWNLAFRDLAHEFVFRPLVGRCGISAATTAVFLVSGLIHDLVISGAAEAGFGRPTLYFLIQAAGLFIERSHFGKHLGLGRGWIGWTFAGIVILGPVGLLFHRPFIEQVVVPMLRAFGRI